MMTIYYMLIIAGILFFVSGITFVFRELLMSKAKNLTSVKSEMDRVKGELERSLNVAAELREALDKKNEVLKNEESEMRKTETLIDDLTRRLAEVAESKKRGEKFIQGLQESMDQLEHGRDQGGGSPKVDTAEILSSIEGIKRVTEDQKKTSREIKKRIENDMTKYRL